MVLQDQHSKYAQSVNASDPALPAFFMVPPQKKKGSVCSKLLKSVRLTSAVVDFERRWHCAAFHPLREESTLMIPMLCRFKHDSCWRQENTRILFLFELDLDPSLLFFFDSLCHVLVTPQAFLSVSLPAASQHVIYLLFLPALMSVSSLLILYLVSFLPQSLVITASLLRHIRSS